MFEKSLVDLIRGLRGHKGNEQEYIQSAIKECKAEIKSQDMDVKATGLLKLIYLEMFGNDMTWAAFHVLEVMSSAKQAQKQIGYLAAVQSFRPEMDVLMLAENLLKKDLTSPLVPVLTLPLATLPHIITSSLALSILSDLLPRLSHSQPAVRKKTIATLYRLALVYPETLRVAWPKIKDRLMDESEDSSVKAATVNVVCELGWRRPQEFLPLAPRLFDLLIDGGNNWMAIKIIKLFAILTPLEPRLVRKLVRPLTNLIHKTSAMSLLYECISGIIQGGILDGSESGVDVEEVAEICISKLRGMIVLEGDPNLKYVALLAFNRIVKSHPSLVSRQKDVIFRCLDDPDISIKMQALDLVCGMVNAENLQGVVDNLRKQLANVPKLGPTIQQNSESHADNTDLEQKLTPDKRGSEVQPLPDEYRSEVIRKILDMCAAGNYGNIVDFEWYIEILTDLVHHLPPTKSAEATSNIGRTDSDTSVLASRIGDYLRDVAVRVRELRVEITRVCERFVLISERTTLFSSHGAGINQILKAAVWVCGEFATSVFTPYDVLNSLIHDTSCDLHPPTLSLYVQAVPKIYAQIAITASQEWNISRRSMQSMLLGRIVAFLDKLSTHPNLEVQERAVEYLELFRVAAESLQSQEDDSLAAPLLFTSAIPDLFRGSELNPVAASAQRKVPVPSDLDLDAAINPNLASLLADSQLEDRSEDDDLPSTAFYHERESYVLNQPLAPASAFQHIEPNEVEPTSYQSAPENSPSSGHARRKAERRAFTKDDPFYIPSGRSSPIHDALSRANGEELDLDSIPIVDLQISTDHVRTNEGQQSSSEAQRRSRKTVRRFHLVADETLEPSQSSGNSANGTPPRSTSVGSGPKPVRPARNLLSVDSSSLGGFSLNADKPSDQRTQLEIERREAEEAEMAAAIREVEQKRLEMQRDVESAGTVMAEGVDVEGTIVKKKKKRKPKVGDASPAPGMDEPEAEEVVVKKKKKKKRPVIESGEPEQVL